MWLVILSDQLPVRGLVHRYYTNYLMGRSPLLQPQKFPLMLLVHQSVCGISSAFALLSPAGGQVGYVLRTRSPLGYIAASPFDLHVLGTPPAFILSQDQTLRKKIFHSCEWLFTDFLLDRQSCCFLSLFSC